MSAQAQRVGRTMTLSIVWLAPGDSIRHAHDIMQTEDIRHIPILENGKIVGILSDRDVLASSCTNAQYQIEFPKNDVDSIMTRFPVTCHADATISDVAEMMVKRKIDCLPVVNHQNDLVGMITSTDLLSLWCNSRAETTHGVIPFEYTLARRSVCL